MADSSFKFLAAVLFIFPQVVWTAPKTQEGFLDLPSGHSLFYRHKPRLRGAPNLVLLNGLDHDSGTWLEFTELIGRANPEIGILSYDMQGMGKTLQNEMMLSLQSYTAFKNIEGIAYEEQTEDLRSLIKQLKIKGPIYLFGLSYGGAIAFDFMAKYPQLAKQAILASPYLAPLPQQDSSIRQQIELVRQFRSHPLNAFSDDRLYDLFLIPMISIYPVFEPILVQEPWRLSGVYRMVQGARRFSAIEISQKLRPDSIHVLWAEKDQYLARDQVINFHTHAPQNIFSSESILKDVHHDMLKQAPHYLAFFVLKAISGHRRQHIERRITAYPYEGYAEFGEGSWKFEADTKPLIDQFYLSKFETFLSPITWKLLDGGGDDCRALFRNK